MNGDEPTRPPSIRDVPAGIPLDGAVASSDRLRRLHNSSLPFDNRRLNRAPASAMGLSQSFWREWVGHRSYLMQLALRWMSGNRSDAEDVLSRASIKAHDRYLRDAGRIRNLRSWLARLLHNVCMDEHRKRLVRGKLIDYFHPDQLGHLSHGRNEPCLDEQIGNADSMDVTMRAIMDMPVRLRHPFVLRFLYQYSNQEIARHLELTEVSVRKRIQLGRSFVRERLQTSDK